MPKPKFTHACGCRAHCVAAPLRTCCAGIPPSGGYKDSLNIVVPAYLKGAFLFDLCTSIPVSYIEILAVSAPLFHSR